MHSDTPWTGRFECSSDLVNQLWRNVTWGQRGNFLSVPTDCPQRDERLGWLADAQVFLPSAALNMDVAAFITKWGDDILDAQSADGAYPDVAPRLGAERDGAPAWGDAGIIVPWTIYQRYGDVRILERHWDAMERYVAYLVRHNPDLLWRSRRHNDYGDWLSVGADTPREVLATAYLAYDAKLMARIARVLGRADREAHYERCTGTSSPRSTGPTCGEDGFIEGDTQTVYLLALHMDLVPDELRERVAERLVADIERHDWHLTTGFIGVGLLCPVLTEAGYADVAYRLLLNETFPSWGYSIRHGATTIWERWDGWTEERGFQTPLMNSFNHYSLGSVAQWLYEYVAGIRLDPERPGYEHVRDRARARRAGAGRGDVPLGPRARSAAPGAAPTARFALDVEVPANVTATVVLPGGRGTEGGVDAARPESRAASRERRVDRRDRLGAYDSSWRRQSESSFARARARSSERVRTPSFAYTWLRWNSTVLVLSISSSATSRFVMPDTTSRVTASSCGVSARVVARLARRRREAARGELGLAPLERRLGAELGEAPLRGEERRRGGTPFARPPEHLALRELDERLLVRHAERLDERQRVVAARPSRARRRGARTSSLPRACASRAASSGFARAAASGLADAMNRSAASSSPTSTSACAFRCCHGRNAGSSTPSRRLDRIERLERARARRAGRSCAAASPAVAIASAAT